MILKSLATLYWLCGVSLAAADDIPFVLGIVENQFRPISVFLCSDYATGFQDGVCVLHVSSDGHQLLFFFVRGDMSPAFFVVRTPEEMVKVYWLVGLPI